MLLGMQIFSNLSTEILTDVHTFCLQTFVFCLKTPYNHNFRRQIE